MNKKQPVSKYNVQNNTMDVQIIQYPHITLQSLIEHNNINHNLMATQFRKYKKQKLNGETNNLEQIFNDTIQYHHIKNFLKSSHNKYYAIVDNNSVGPYTTHNTALIRAKKEQNKLKESK